jgi:hypothetical protein
MNRLPLALSLMALSFLGYAPIAVAQEPTQHAVVGADRNQTVANNLLSHGKLLQSLSRSGMLGGSHRPDRSLAESLASSESWIDRTMGKHSFLWSIADGVDTGTAVLFPGADPETGVRYVFAAMPDKQTIFGLGPMPERNSIRLIDLSTNTAVEIPASGYTPQRPERASGAEAAGRLRPEIDLPGVASNIAAVASCLWNNITSTLSVHSWSDFANLTCQMNGMGNDAKAMWNFGKEITGCASAGIADCFFLGADLGIFLGNASCRPDWVNACMNPGNPGNPPPVGGGATAAIILGITPLSTPVPGQQFYAQIHATNLVSSYASVAVTGPGCPQISSCVVPNGVITFIGTDYLNVPLRLAQGNFEIYISQLGQTSNGWPLSVGSPSGSGGSSSNLAISFTPNPVSRSSDGGWYYSVTVRETAGTAVNLTGMKIGGGDYSSSISSWFGTTAIPAYGQISVSIKTTGSSGAMVWEFSSGSQTWSASVNLN